MVKQRPILFSTPMVRAILEGRKSQTRRKKGFSEIYEIDLMKNIEWEFQEFNGQYAIFHWTEFGMKIFKNIKCPYGQLGDILWVRETFTVNGTEAIRGGDGEILEEKKQYVFKGQKLPHIEKLYKWKPSIFMPKAACRIFLEITDIRVERLQDISEEDAIKEGVNLHNISGDWEHTPAQEFEILWGKINGNESWQLNLWVF